MAIALAGDPDVVLADEPTTGLDRPLVYRTVDALAALAAEGRAVLMITHDLEAARRAATHIAVMYASRIVELGLAADVLSDPWHPYTTGLLRALPDAGFTAVPGHPPELTACPRAARSGPGVRSPTSARAILISSDTVTGWSPAAARAERQQRGRRIPQRATRPRRRRHRRRARRGGRARRTERVREVDPRAGARAGARAAAGAVGRRDAPGRRAGAAVPARRPHASNAPRSPRCSSSRASPSTRGSGSAR